ncbi:hypothetical protein [Ruminococcus sp.]
MPETKSFYKSEKFYFILFVLLSAVGILIDIPYCHDGVIKYDSTYQYFLTLHPWNEIWRLLPEDYSPPLYALLLKLVCVIFGHTLKVMRFTNSIVIVGLVFLSMFPIRKAFGAKTGIVAAAGFICTSVNSFLFNEIRPTYLAYFFLTANAVYAYLAFFEGKRSYYVLHGLFTLLCMYTHNIAMLGALAIYILVLLFSVIKKDKKRFLSFFISGCICAVLYLPWLTVVLKQFGNVTDHYWKEDFFPIYKIKEYCITSILYFNSPKLLSAVIENSFSLLFKLLILFFILKNINIKGIKKLSDIKSSPLFSDEKRASYFKGLFVLLLFLFPLLLFEITLRTVYPFVAIRYYLLFTGPAIIFLSIVFTKIEKRIVPILCIAALIANTAVIRIDARASIQTAGFPELVDRIEEENPDGNICFLHSHEFSLGIMSYFFPNATHYVYDGTWTVLNDLSVFPNEPVNIGELDNIKKYTDHFYTFSPLYVEDEATDLAEYFADSPDYVCGKRKRYEYPLTIIIEEVEVKKDAE